MSLKKRVVPFFVFLLTAGLAYLFLAPVPINPGAWTPAPAPGLTGQYEKNMRLSTVQRLSLGEGHKPEDVALDAEGRIYAGFEDGRIMVLQPDGTQPQLFSFTGGRPLGLIFDAEGNLIVADAIKGLLSINKFKEVRVLAADIDGKKFGCINDLDVAADGTIYFTEASNKFPMDRHIEELLEHQPNGRLLAFDPKTGKSRTVLPDLYFANGVAVSPDQTFVLVAETAKYRIRRVWLKESKNDIFIDNLPGFPDGISSNGKDKFWLALVTPRQTLVDRMMPYPFVRKIVVRLPNFLRPGPERYSFVLGLDEQGRVTDNLQNGSSDTYAQIANVVERNGFLYFGSIGEDTLGRFSLR